MGVPLSAMHHGSADRVDGDLDGLPADLELEAALRGRDSELAVRQVRVIPLVSNMSSQLHVQHFVPYLILLVL